MENILTKYAALLVNYCLEIKEGDKLFVRSTTLAEPLVREVFRLALRAGAVVEVDLEFRERNRILLQEADESQLRYVPALYSMAMESFDAYLFIRAPFNLREDQSSDAVKSKIVQEANKPAQQAYFERTATRALKRNLCQFPTIASAQEAGMSLEEYEHFVYGACKLFDEDPTQSWLNVRKAQQSIVDLLNSREKIHYKGGGTDITFSTKGRTWINSDGKTNMPSGEVYTSPVEDSVNGVVHFTYPALYMGHEVEGVTLWVKDGYIERWEAKRGKDLLDRVFQIEGTRRFGEAAIGTNYSIGRFSRNILFDEKIGGTIHMAIGQSYLQTGGKNESPVHWDMIADMKQGGEIFADGELIYADGQFCGPLKL
ncbi:MAG: aminopeptidase [Saprospiraceae bacterium]|nr:aminopeptidase [Saprospiraceae bacterium]MDZ4703002.1 aminopeptidase [Saprospiraceae bacterium]